MSQEKRQSVLDALAWPENAEADPALVPAIQYYCAKTYGTDEESKKDEKRDWDTLRGMAQNLPKPPKSSVGRKANKAGQYVDDTTAIEMAAMVYAKTLYEICPNLLMDGSGNDYAQLSVAEKAGKIHKSLRTQVVAAWKVDKFSVPESVEMEVNEEE